MPDLTATATAALPLADAHGWWFLFPLGWLLLLFLVFFAFRRFWWGPGCGYGPRYACGGWREPDHPEHPAEILGRRFASGEIDVEEYRARRAALED